MIINLLQIILPDAVGKRHFFLETMQTEPLLWLVRGLGIVITIIMFVMYRNMKRKDGE